ncbi:hypothetical protein B0H19DRAFT_1231342 [Mycena capillaripes]|nr:hypothetical protein B0H19DRAFT_1231342 [Mycena capillaripes]
MCLRLFRHRRWRYNRELSALFPFRQRCMALHDYVELFLLSIENIPRIQDTYISSVAYCRIRGASNSSYPVLIVYLKYPEFDNFPIIRFKLQGFDGPTTTVWADDTCPSYDYDYTPGERSTFSVASVHDSMVELVGTWPWRYDTLHTLTFSPSVSKPWLRRPSVVELLVLVDLSMKWDHTREGYPATLFLALKSLFNGFVTSHRKATPLPSNDVSEEMKRAVIDLFPTRRQRMQKKINFCSGRSFHRWPLGLESLPSVIAGGWADLGITAYIPRPGIIISGSSC